MEWFFNLEDEEQVFIRKFILASGSMKDLAKQYNVSYPTIRSRVDKLIEKIKITDNIHSSFDSYILQLVINDKLPLSTAKLIISKHNEETSND